MVALMEQNSLYDRPDLYDLIAPSDPALECFYVATAGERGGRVLDLACGSGRLTIPLARSGLQVTGGDLSAKMLERARCSAEALTVELDLVQLDMRHFDLNGRTFDTIIVAMNSILHLHSLDDFSGFFRSVARTSITEGQAGVRRLLPECGHAQWRSRQASIGQSDCPRYARQDHCRGNFSDTIPSPKSVTWIGIASTPEKKDFWKTPLQMRNIFPQEMPLLIASGGLRLVERFGDFDRSPLVPGSVRQVCVCDCPG